jgi:sugar diacid utilization regulator
MMKQRSAQDAEVRVKGTLLGDLVTGRFQDEEDVREWSGYLKLDFAYSPYRIIVAKPATSRSIAGQERQDPRGFERIRGKLVGLIRNFSCRFGLGAAVAIGDHVVGLFPLRESEDPHEVAEHLLKLAHKEVPDLSVRLGISDVCLRPLDISKRYQEIAALVDLADRLKVPSQTICYDDWKVYGLLVKASNQEDVSKLARETLYPILRQDQGGQLLTTLEAYIENGLNMSRTATTLYVHPNTVKYRLRRVSELLGVNLDNLDDVLTIKIALMIKSLAPESFDPANL